ncbi:protein kinase family protein [Kitasatospora herbaricolor]|uniref:Protein kinase family protein n=1 Tax=Kitasatospora herbaricolor TaxID=68217 RepID=A0ABZ1WA74_9ACTN|nr:protein kinase family protein [Kitasatospora herbaricolor]
MTTVADGTKAVVDTPEADEATDEAALAMAIDDLAGDDPAGPQDAEEVSETTAPLSADEIAVELAAGAALAAAAKAKADAAAAARAEAEAKAEAEAGARAAAKAGAAVKAGAPVKSGAAAKAKAGNDTRADGKAGDATGAKAQTAPGGAAQPLPGATGRPGAQTPAKAAPRAVATAGDTGGTGALPLTLPAPLRHSGDVIGGRYRLEECISQSGTFSSWRAVDEKLRRAVGVHLMAAGHQRSRAVLAAAKSAALLGDPRFVQVLDAVQEGELVYVVREWLPDASDLAKLLTTGPMEPYDAYQMVRQVTDAIATAHRRGQAHLRLTPRCVLRTEGGQYRINGIAVDAALRGLPADDSADAELTDTRAIGVLLYAALTHRWPFPEDRYDLQGLPKGLGQVPPSQVRAGVHKGLSELAARILCDPPPHHGAPITTPEDLAKAIALMPRIRQPEPELPAFTPPRRTPPPPAPVTASAPAGPAFHGPLPYPTRPRRRRLRRVLKATAWTVALAAVGFSSWQLVGQLRGSNHTTDTAGPTVTRTDAAHPQIGAPVNTAPAGTPVTIADVKSFNPLGDSPESVPRLPLTHDGNPDTTWTTLDYRNPLQMIKEGTGLLVDLGSPQQVGSVSVQFVGSTRVELRVPTTQSATAPGKPGDYRAIAQSTGAQADLRPEAPVTTRYLLIWMTDLPKDGGVWHGQVSEIKVTG